MKFCPKCNDRMSGEFCTTCDKDKLPERIKFSDYSNQKPVSYTHLTLPTKA